MSYKEFIELIVCDTNNKECMIHRCDNCPGTTPLKTHLDTLLKEELNKEEISFKQWTTTDRAELINRVELVDDFIDLLIMKLDNLTTHSYISKSQAKYLKDLKENLKSDEVIVLGDFAENYQFVIQDEIQGYHWNSSQCTLHPIMVYYKDVAENKLLSHSLCFISDDITHDVDMVYEVVSNTINFIKSFLPNIITTGTVHYFSDGCAGQYKNCKNILNQCLHYKDFSIKSTWSFFATSHGKSPCDGIGGTIKRLTARASLQRTSADQITTTEQMVEFCQEKIVGITTIFIPTLVVQQRRETMKERYKIAKTIPGTRSFHFFIPTDEYTISTKRVSEDESFSLVFKFKKESKTPSIQRNSETLNVNISSYVACTYDDSVCIGVVLDKCDDNKDIQVKFLHPKFPSPSYHWPEREDLCWITEHDIVTVIESPTVSGRTGRQY
jgi:hypothetical protein